MGITHKLAKFWKNLISSCSSERNRGLTSNIQKVRH